MVATEVPAASYPKPIAEKPVPAEPPAEPSPEE
jgi:hypothetical protein